MHEASMKIIPIFVSHMGCKNQCVFCNQRHITGCSEGIAPEKLRDHIDKCLASIHAEKIGLAFYGGSFTGIEVSLQSNYLKIANEYKEAGLVHHIRLSTRPDYLDNETLLRLKQFNVDLIELGVQSFNDHVLIISKRGHLSNSVYDAVSRIKLMGLSFGIQLMVGLPGDSMEGFFFSVNETLKLKPQVVRIYPVLVIESTELADWYRRDIYHPLTLDEAINMTAVALKEFENNQINIIRVGLQSTDLIENQQVTLAGPYHAAFKDLVMDALFYQSIAAYINRHRHNRNLTISVNPKNVSHIRGHKKINANLLKDTFGIGQIRIEIDECISVREISILNDKTDQMHTFDIYKI